MIKEKHGSTRNTDWVVNMDLTGATVELSATRQDGTGSKVILPSTVTNAAGGVIRHKLTGTLAPGRYNVEAKVTQAGTDAYTPSDGMEVLIIVPNNGD